MAKLPKKVKKPLHWIISEKLRAEIEVDQQQKLILADGQAIALDISYQRYIAYGKDQQPLVCSETLSRADRTCYSVSLKNTT